MRKFIIVLAMANGIASMCYGQGFIRMNINQPAPLASFAGSDTLVCSNHPVILGGSPSATGGNHSYVYLWSPADGLNDPTSSNPTATLSETKSYVLSVTDNQGCQATSSITVHIDACLGTNSQNLNQVISVFPNPSNGIVKILGLNTLQGQVQNIEVLNHLGQILLTKTLRSGDIVSDFELDTNIKEPGIYFLKITLSNRVISKRLIVR
jgi:hypothetical protein